MTSVKNEIEHHLRLLIGLPLSIVRRAADLLVLHFGAIREIEIGIKAGKPRGKGTVGDFSLHIQCPWRIEDATKIITGQGDLYLSAETGEYFDDVENGDTCYEFGKNLQDKRIGELLQGLDPITGSYINATKSLVVEKVDADNFGGATIYLSGGYRLSIFPYSTQGEHWRLIRCEADVPHFVVSGSQVEVE